MTRGGRFLGFPVPFWFRCATAGAALAGGALAQSTWIVDAAGGAGSHFKTLADAVKNASAGDTLLVRRGAYLPVTVDKGLRILGDHVPFIEYGPNAAAFSIQGIPAGQTCVVRGWRFDPVHTVPRSAPLVTIRDCAGRVMIRDSRIGSVATGTGLAVSNSAAASLESCVVIAGVTVERSKLLGVGTRFAESAATDAPVVASSSQLTLVGCHSGSRSFPFVQPAVRCSGTSLDLRGGSYLGGDDGHGSHAPALVGDAASALRRDRHTALSTPPHSGFGSVGSLPVASLAVSGGELGAALTVGLVGEVADPFVLFVGLPAAPVHLPGAGDVWLDPLALAPVATGQVSRFGTAHLTRHVPNDPNLVGVTVSYQAVLGTGHAMRLTNAGTVAVFRLGV